MKTTTIALRRWNPGAMVLALAAVGCAEPPTAEMEAAYEVQDEAVANGATEYAPASMERVWAYRAELENELAVQEDRWAVRRSYGRALALTDSLRQAASAAAEEAVTARQAASEEAGRLIADARIALDETRASLAAAPVGKGTAADLGMMQADVEMAARSLDEAESDFQAEAFLEARAKATAAMETLTRVRSSVTVARQIIG